MQIAIYTSYDINNGTLRVRLGLDTKRITWKENAKR